MTGIDRRGNTPMGPPWPVDVLADLHAGVFYDAADLLPRARQDPDASTVLDALDATRAELSGLASRPTPPMPEHLAARLDAAIAAEAQATFPAPRRPAAPEHPVRPAATAGQFAPVTDLAAASNRRKQRMGWGIGTLVAAAAVAVAVIVIPHSGRSTTGVAAPPPTTSSGVGATATGPQALTTGQLGSALSAVLGRTEYGSLSDPATRAACLTANHQDPNRTPAGAMRVTLDGKPGVLLVLTTGQTAQFRLLVVGPDCAAGKPDTLANIVVGGVPPTTH